MSLRDRFSQLAVSTEEFEGFDFEDVSFEDMVDHVVGTLEEYSHAVDTLALAIERYEGMDDIAIEDLEPEIQALLTGPAMEDHGFDMGLEATVGGVSNFLSRYWQVYFLDYLTTFDWIVDLVKTQEGKASKYSKRLTDIRNKFAGKKHNLDYDEHTSSYVMLHNYWFTGSGFVKDVFGQLKTEEHISKYVMQDYPKQVDHEIGQFISLVKSADLSSADAYEKTVVNRLSHFKHPVKLFDRSLLGGRPYMMNTGFNLSRKSKDSSKSYIDQLSHPNKVVVTKWLTGFQMQGGVVPKIIPDVKFSTHEIDDLLNWGDVFIDMSRKMFHDAEKMKHRSADLRAALESMGHQVKDTNNKQAVKEMRQLGQIGKNLIDCYWSPSLKMAKRNLDLVKGIAYLGGRLVASAK